VDISKGLPDKILLKWGKRVYSQPVDCENTTFCNRSIQQLGHLQNVCPYSQGTSSHPETKKKNCGWQDPKGTNGSKSTVGHRSGNCYNHNISDTNTTPAVPT